MTAEQQLTKIAEIFSAFKEEGRHRVTNHARFNLEAALEDIEAGKRSEAAINTIKRVIDQLVQIENVLGDRVKF